MTARNKENMSLIDLSHQTVNWNLLLSTLNTDCYNPVIAPCILHFKGTHYRRCKINELAAGFNGGGLWLLWWWSFLNKHRINCLAWFILPETLRNEPTSPRPCMKRFTHQKTSGIQSSGQLEWIPSYHESELETSSALVSQPQDEDQNIFPSHSLSSEVVR